MNHRLSVVIVNFNSGSHLSACLASVAENLVGVSWDGVVVDNASADGSESAAASFEPRVRLRRNPANLGFARAVNQGIALTSGTLVLLLNPDCRLFPDAISLLGTELDAHPECALVGPRILDQDGKVQGSARGDPTMLTGLFGRSTVLTRLFPRARLARNNIRTDSAIASSSRSVEVDWVSGACMLARRQALGMLGGFDEGYFLYWEDADLCRRLRAAGLTVRYVPGARAVHLVGQSTQSVRSLAVRAFHESAYTYYTAHVVTSRFHPARWLAWLLLRVRCGWKLMWIRREARDRGLERP